MAECPDFYRAMDIKAQTISSLTILAPGAKAVNIGVIKGIWEAPATTVSAGGNATLLSVSGRGRFRRLTVFARTMTNDSAMSEALIRLAVDGTDVVYADLKALDLYHGNVAISWLVGKAAGNQYPPTPTQRIFNVPYLKLVTAPANEDGDPVWSRICVTFEADVEYTASLLLRYYNDDASDNHDVKAIIEYGGYP